MKAANIIDVKPLTKGDRLCHPRLVALIWASTIKRSLHEAIHCENYTPVFVSTLFNRLRPDRPAPDGTFDDGGAMVSKHALCEPTGHRHYFKSAVLEFVGVRARGRLAVGGLAVLENERSSKIKVLVECFTFFRWYCGPVCGHQLPSLWLRIEMRRPSAMSLDQLVGNRLYGVTSRQL